MNENQYFYIENGQQAGPVSVEELVGKITPYTDIWCPGMANWAQANSVPEVAAALAAAPAPEPSPAPTDEPASSQYTNNNDYTGNANNYGNPQQDFGNSNNYGNPQNPVIVPNNYGNPQGAPAGNRPDNYLVWAILSTILCCNILSLPFGIISIVNAAKVNSEWDQGNYSAAENASENAKKFAIITAIVGFVVNLISVIISLNNR